MYRIVAVCDRCGRLGPNCAKGPLHTVKQEMMDGGWGLDIEDFLTGRIFQHLCKRCVQAVSQRNRKDSEEN